MDNNKSKVTIESLLSLLLNSDQSINTILVKIGVTLVVLTATSLLAMVLPPSHTTISTFTTEDIENIKGFFKGAKLPEGMLLGVETLSTKGKREILWVSDDRLFWELKGKSLFDQLDLNDEALTAVKSYVAIYNECYDGKDITLKDRVYFACPIPGRTQGQPKGISWLYYDKNSEINKNEIIKLFNEISHLIEENR